MTIRYTDSIAGLVEEDLLGFFEGWSDPPSPETHLALLAGSDHVLIAMDENDGKVAGFVTAVSDGVLCAYVPFLEVLPRYRGKGVGSGLMRRMLERLRDLYMVDLTCDRKLQPFYGRLGMRPSDGMMLRNHGQQCGEERP